MLITFSADWFFWHLELWDREFDCCKWTKSIKKTVLNVCDTICELKENNIQFPEAAAHLNYKIQFYEHINFSAGRGCIDGYQFPLWFPTTTEAKEHRDNKTFSINVQDSCTPYLELLNCFGRVIPIVKGTHCHHWNSSAITWTNINNMNIMTMAWNRQDKSTNSVTSFINTEHLSTSCAFVVHNKMI